MADQMDMRMMINQQILAQGHSDEQMTRDMNADGNLGSGHFNAPRSSPHRGADAASRTPTKANEVVTEWNLPAEPGGALKGEYWPPHLPRPPSRKKITEEEEDEEEKNSKVKTPRVIVFNANTQEGSSMVRVLSERGLKVIAVVRVFTSRNAKRLTKLKGVTVKVADLNNREAVILAAQGCQQAFLVTKYWERFENPIEESMAKVVLEASSVVGITRLILATFEDTAELRLRGRKSQIMPTVDGRIFPQFEGMDDINILAKQLGIQITHMMTSYLDETDSKKSLILIRGADGKIICQPYFQGGAKK